MRKENLAITSTTGLTFVKRTDLLYCCSDGAYTKIYLAGGRKLIVSKNLKEVEKALADDNFIRIHNSHLINLDHAIGYINNNYNCVKMSNGEELAVSRNKKKDLMECFVKI